MAFRGVWHSIYGVFGIGIGGLSSPFDREETGVGAFSERDSICFAPGFSALAILLLP
jgi:hypothetical protein